MDKQRIYEVLKEAFELGYKARETDEKSNRGFGYTLLVLAPVAIIVFGVQLALFCFDVVRKKPDAPLIEKLSGWLFLLAVVLLTAAVVMARVRRRASYDKMSGDLEKEARSIIDDNRYLLSALPEKYWLPSVVRGLLEDDSLTPEDVLAEMRKDPDQQLQLFVDESVRRRLLGVPNEEDEFFPGLFK